MTKDTKNNLNLLKKEDHVFYHQKYNLVFIAPANKIKTLIELYIEILKLLPSSEYDFDLFRLSSTDKARIQSNFQRVVEKNQSYLGWKVVKASDWDPEKFLNPVYSKEFFSKNNIRVSAPEDSSFLSMKTGSLPMKTQKIDDKFNLTEIFQNVSKFLQSYFLESTFNEFQKFILTLKNNDKKIIVISLGDQFLKDEFKAFSQPGNSVFSKETMINFLSQSASLYHSLCLWFLKLDEKHYKPFTLKTKEILCFEKHHIIPRYLNYNHELNGLLENSYNLIKIPRLIHVLLHFIRAIEFHYYEDQNYVKSLGPSWNIYIKSESNILKFNNVLKNSLGILNTALENSQDFQKRKKDFFIKRELATEANLNITIKETFSREMTWANRDYPIKSVTIAPNVMKKVRDLFNYLIEILEDYFQENSENSQVSKPENWNKLITTRNNYDYLSNYLKGDIASQNPLFGWYLENPNQKMIERAQKSENVKIRGTTPNLQVNNMLDNGGYVWENKDLKIKSIPVMPGRFKRMNELADYLVSKMPQNKQPKNWFTQDKVTKKTRLSKRFTQVVKGGLKKYRGWELKKKKIKTLSY